MINKEFQIGNRTNERDVEKAGGERVVERGRKMEREREKRWGE